MRLALADLGFDLRGPIAERIIAAASGSVSEALKLINYGGLDIAAAFEDVLAGQGPAVRKQMHKLADILSAKDSETIYDFFSSLVTGLLAGSGCKSAGDIQRAERFARLSSSFAERIALGDAYNLDRKQTILSLLDDLKDAL